jgi:hypothetical protein
MWGSITAWMKRSISSRESGDQTLRWAKTGEGFWPLGFASVVLIKPIFENGDLESSQKVTVHGFEIGVFEF